MKIHDVLRRLRLLRTVAPEPQEAENQVNLAEILRDRFSVGSEEVRSASKSVYQTSWIEWQELLGEFDIQLRHFGRRGNALLKNGKQVLIKLNNDQWHVQQKSPGGWETIARDWGRESFRAYMIESVAPRYPFFLKKPGRPS